MAQMMGACMVEAWGTWMGLVADARAEKERQRQGHIRMAGWQYAELLCESIGKTFVHRHRRHLAERSLEVWRIEHQTTRLRESLLRERMEPLESLERMVLCMYWGAGTKLSVLFVFSSWCRFADLYHAECLERKLESESAQMLREISIKN